MSTHESYFEKFFGDPIYLEFKNHFYNYLRRKEVIGCELSSVKPGILLEIGCGISPVTPPGPEVVYTDLSSTAVAYLKAIGRIHKGVAMSAAAIPFCDASISTVVCAEVLEHIPDDEQALREIRRILRIGGDLILTVPINPRYYSHDDAFVKHCRRYDLTAFVSQLRRMGFSITKIRKVSGLLDKFGLLVGVYLFRFVRALKMDQFRSANAGLSKGILPLYKALNWLFFQLVKAEIQIMPNAVVTDLLIRCTKTAPHSNTRRV
ncbi:MAG: class I SAM-dependent methyltransferase [Candidatus Omnitrophica bacterium]|nr:class I SAM-dependent methyltransferase [Candidatus Omnitrophota bacterium]